MKRLYFASLHNCNEDCVFCVRRGDETPIEFINTEKSKKLLFEKKKQGYQEIYFDGGEPTLRKDLVELIDFAKNKGFKAVNILTNAILLADDELTKKLLTVKNNKNFTLSFLPYLPNPSAMFAIIDVAAPCICRTRGKSLLNFSFLQIL